MTLISAIAMMLVFVNVGRFHDAVQAVTGTLPIGKPLVALGILGLLAADPAGQIQKILNTRQGKALAVFTFSVVLSVPFSYVRSGSLDITIKFLLAGIPIVLVTAGSVRRIENIENLFKCAVLVVIGYAVFFASPLAVVSDGADGPRTSLAGSYDPNDIALVTSTCMAFCLWATRDKSWMWRILGVVGLLGGSYVLMRTYSRGGFLAISAMLLLATFVVKGTLPGWFRTALIPLLVVGVLASPEKFRERLMTLTKTSEDYNTTVLAGRQAIWTRGMGYFARRPLTGIGVGQFSAAEGRWGEENGIGQGWKWSAPHNMYVESAAELGILGIASVIAIFVTTLSMTLKRIRIATPSGSREDDAQRRAAGAIFLAFSGFAVGATFVTAAFSPAFMFLLSLAIGFAALPVAARDPRASAAASRTQTAALRGNTSRIRATRWQGRPTGAVART